MNKYQVPAEIRELKPKGTIVKKINGNKYYVYEHFNRKDKNGKWKTVTGKMIGTITLENGFIPNKNGNIGEEITTLEYGQYAIVYECSKKVLEDLKMYFSVKEAQQIYFMAIIHFVNKFTYLKDIKLHFEQCYLSINHKDIKMSYYVLSKLLDSLGRKQRRVIDFQQYLIDNSSKKIAIDGHVISCSSHENDLAEYGNKYSMLKEMQINVLVAYDVNNLKPLLSKVYEGSMSDKTSIKDLLTINDFKSVLLIVDKGFYSKENIELFSQNDNQYIIPLGQNLKEYKEAIQDMTLNGIFIYERNKKISTIEYKEIKKQDKTIYVYKDLNQNAIDRSNYVKNMDSNPKKYTKEKYDVVKDFFGVIVIQTNCPRTAQEVFILYKKRWKIETYYNYFKNNANFNALYLSDYYMTQGLSFVMLVVGLIHKEVSDKIKKANLNKSVDDILLECKFLKINKYHDNWKITNAKKELQNVFEALNINIV